MENDLINFDLWQITLRAFRAAKTAGDGYLGAGKYVARQAAPDWKVNSSGWPACVQSSRLFGTPTDPPDWTQMFSVGTPIGGMSVSDVPTLESACSDLVELAMDDPRVERAVSIVSLAYEDDPEERHKQIKHEFLHTLGNFLNRADALDTWANDEVREIYRAWEKGAFLAELSGDMVIPIVMGAVPVDLDGVKITDDVHIELMDVATQIARAPQMGGIQPVNPFHRAAATHAIVISDVSISSEWLRFPKPSLSKLDLGPVDTAIEALSIVTEDESIGYADVLLRPKDWARQWVGEHPPLVKLVEVERVPRDQRTVWNDQRVTYDPSRVQYMNEAFRRLKDAPPKVRIASRRVMRATLRDDSEDAFLDAMIGVEALLGRERDEITFRLALRAATALAWKWNTNEIFNLVKFLYGQRSAVVHGSGKVKEYVQFHNEQYQTHVMAPWLLRELFHTWLTTPEPWTPVSLDGELLSGLANTHVHGSDKEG